MKKTTALLLALCMVLCLFAGCGSTEETGTTAEASTSTETTATTEAPAIEMVDTEEALASEETISETLSGGTEETGIVSTRDTIKIGGSAEPQTLDPINQMSMIVSQMAHIMYNTLFTMDEHYNVVGDLVEEYENVSDTEWHFKIYEGVKFHDGTDLTTEDVKATLDYVHDNSYSGTYVASISEVIIEDDYNFTIITSAPDASLLGNFCQAGTSILPSEKIASGWDFNAEPCGSGPYKFVSWTKGDNLTYEAFDEYFKGTPYIKNLIWKFIPESSSRTIALEAGEIDYIFDPATADLSILSSDDGIKVQGANGLTMMNFCVNIEACEWWNDVNVRKAFYCAIDREAIVTAALNGYGSPAYGVAPNDLAGENKSTMPSDCRNMELAQQYLDASGYKGEDITFTLLTVEGERSIAAQIIQSNLAELGITVNCEIGESAAVLEVTSNGNFEASIQGVSNTMAIDYLRRLYVSAQIGGQNCVRYSDPELDARITDIISILDEETRIAAVSELEADLGELCLYTPLYCDMAFRAYDDALQGVNFNGAYFTQYHTFYFAD